jgi:LAO/AO transport system ATPase
MGTVQDLVGAAAVEGPASIRPAARLMTIVADEPARLPEIYEATGRIEGLDPGRRLLPRLLVGVTGSPGSGKSTLTDGLIREYRTRYPGRRVGVVAVDPSSPFTGGAVLGDRVRMMRHATDPMVFVRSMASRGHLGGLALGVKGVVRVMGLIGCDVVFVETVGVGQSEVEVAAVADLVIIVMAPGQGDSVQLLKAGLMEIGDLFVVNKADRPDAARLHSEVLAMLRVAREAHAGPTEAGHAGAEADPALVPDLVDEESGLLPIRRPGTDIEPRTFLVSAEQGQGVGALVDGLEEIARTHAPRWQQGRFRAIEDEVRDAVLEAAASQLRQACTTRGADTDPVQAILDGRLTVDEAAVRLLQRACRASARDKGGAPPAP